MANDTVETVLSIEDAFCEVGGHTVSGFAESGVKLPSSDAKVTSKKGLDSVAWIKVNESSLEREVVLTLLADSASVKYLKTFEKTNVIIPFRFEWEDIGVYFEALECRVEETGDFEFSGDMPEIEFKVTCRNVTEMKGL